MAIQEITLPSPPFIDIPGLPNFRDAGGYPVYTPAPDNKPPTKMVRRGIVFRASEPSMVTPAGIATMTTTLGIKTVFDLRSQTEIDNDAKKPDGGRQVREWPGSQRVFAPVFTTEDYSPEAMAKRFSAFASEGSEVSSYFSRNHCGVWLICRGAVFGDRGRGEGGDSGKGRRVKRGPK